MVWRGGEPALIEKPFELNGKIIFLLNKIQQVISRSELLFDKANKHCSNIFWEIWSSEEFKKFCFSLD